LYTSSFKHALLYRDEYRKAVSRGGPSIHFFSIADLYNKHDKLLVLDRVEDPIAAFTNRVKSIFSSEFLDALRTRIMVQAFQALNDSFLS
jgi:hypothetical protein